MVLFECLITPCCLSLLWMVSLLEVLLSMHGVRRKCCMLVEVSENLVLKNRLRGLQMVQLECPRVIDPLVLFTFGLI